MDIIEGFAWFIMIFSLVVVEEGEKKDWSWRDNFRGERGWLGAPSAVPLFSFLFSLCFALALGFDVDT